MKLVYHELEPVFDSHSKVLILGSLPSVKSREEGFYYMHPQNRFWKVLEIIFKEKIDHKKEFCLKHHIALWDTISSCEIKNSSDQSITRISVNDLSVILSQADIKVIITTGKKAHEIYQKYLFPIYKIEDVNLPSTSSANALYSLERLAREYQVLLKYLA